MPPGGERDGRPTEKPSGGLGWGDTAHSASLLSKGAKLEGEEVLPY